MDVVALILAGVAFVLAVLLILAVSMLNAAVTDLERTIGWLVRTERRRRRGNG